jgi:hypothetical protein
MSSNTIANAHKIRPRRTNRKLQLWTDVSKIKYAIRLETDLDFLAKSDPEVKQYSTLIAESDTVFSGYEYDWKFILRRWIESHKIATGFKTRSGFSFVHFESIPKKRNNSSTKKESNSSFYVTTLDGKKYSVRKKS